MLTVDGIKTLRERIAPNKIHCGGNEEATKMGMIVPVFRLLGYDPNNMGQFVPEYTADFGSRRGDAVDYAVMFGGDPSMIVECKAVTEAIDKPPYIGQLSRYYAALGASVGVLTNGELYHFFADTDRNGAMDDTPFLAVNMLEDNPERLARELHPFTQEEFDADIALRRARDLQAVKAAKVFMLREMGEPDAFVRDIARRMFPDVKTITQNKRDEAIPIIKKAWREIVEEAVESRIARASAIAFADPAPPAQAVEEEDEEPDNGIITTEEELAALAIVREYAAPLLRAGESVEMTDLKESCKIHLRGKSHKGLIVRLLHKKDEVWALFGDSWGMGWKNLAKLSTVDDLHLHSERINAFTQAALVNVGWREEEPQEPPAPEPPAYEPSIPDPVGIQ